MVNDIKNREQILVTAHKCTMTDRNQTYGDPHTNLWATANIANAYFRAKYGPAWHNLTAEDIADIMMFNKHARRATGSPKPHMDNYVDAASYTAIAGEIAHVDFADPSRTETTYDTTGQMEEAARRAEVSRIQGSNL